MCHEYLFHEGEYGKLRMTCSVAVSEVEPKCFLILKMS